MGTADLAKDLRAQETSATAAALIPALALGLLAARAYGLAALDGIHADLDDDAGFEAACRQGRAMGFDGKTPHPSQDHRRREPHFRADRPTELARARRIIAAHDGGGRGRAAASRWSTAGSSSGSMSRRRAASSRSPTRSWRARAN